jgi:hypothetical protein
MPFVSGTFIEAKTNVKGSNGASWFSRAGSRQAGRRAVTISLTIVLIVAVTVIGR